MVLDLGFIDETQNLLLESRFFPSKVGGKPAWLDLKFIPSSDQLICDACGMPNSFLCQLYCPLDEKESAFHRTIFIFLCLSKNCFQTNSNKNFIVLRSQLPLKNSYYPDTPPFLDKNWRPDISCSSHGVNLCFICGIRGIISCDDRCKQLFCSSYHKQIHNDNQNFKFDQKNKDRPTLLPEFGLSIESVDDQNNADAESESESDDENVENTKQNNLDYMNLLQFCAAHGNILNIKNNS